MKSLLTKLRINQRGLAVFQHGDVTPAGEKFCEILRKVSKRTSRA